MTFEDMDARYMLYGALSVLDNRLQACQNDVCADMTMKQHFLMVSLSLFGDEFPTLKQAGDLLGCSYQNVKRFADQLEAKGYLKVIPDEADKRKLRLVPTEKFSKLSEERSDTVGQLMEQLYCDIPVTDMEITIRTIQKMTENIAGKTE